MDDVRIGFIGAGAVARRHATTLAALPGVRIVAVADPLRGAAEAMAAEHPGAVVRADHRALLDAGGLDAVYICVPPFAHGPPERDVIAAGLPFFVEKPLALDMETATEIAAAARARGLTTAVGYHWRNLDVVERAQALLAARPARLVNATWLDRTPPPPWWTHRGRSGGQTIEQTTHVLDLVRVLAGEVEEVAALEAASPREAFPGADVANVTAATLRFASGALGTVSSTCLLSRKHRAGVELYAEGLAIGVTEADLTVDDGQTSVNQAAAADAKLRVDQDFIAGVRGEQNRIRAPYDEALRSHRLACALARSARERRAVSVGAG